MAAVDYFLKIDTIPGESKDSKHKDEIELHSFSWGETNAGSFVTGGGGGSGKVAMQDFHFVMSMSKASPKLFLACANGEHIKKAVLTCRKAGKEQQEYLKINFSDIMISSYQSGGSGGSGAFPSEQVSFNFAKIEIDYKEQKDDGTLGASTKAGYDIKQNKTV